MFSTCRSTTIFGCVLNFDLIKIIINANVYVVDNIVLLKSINANYILYKIRDYIYIIICIIFQNISKHCLNKYIIQVNPSVGIINSNVFWVLSNILKFLFLQLIRVRTLDDLFYFLNNLSFELIINKRFFYIIRIIHASYSTYIGMM